MVFILVAPTVEKCQLLLCYWCSVFESNPQREDSEAVGIGNQ